MTLTLTALKAMSQIPPWIGMAPKGKDIVPNMNAEKIFLDLYAYKRESFYPAYKCFGVNQPPKWLRRGLLTKILLLWKLHGHEYDCCEVWFEKGLLRGPKDKNVTAEAGVRMT